MPPRKRMLDPGSKAAYQEGLVQRNRVTSILLRLPGELRNKIYSHVLGGRVLRQTRTGSNWISPKMKFLPPLHDNPKNWLSLLLVCRQIYAETRLLPFNLNTFSASRMMNLRPLFKSMNHEQRAQITKFQLEVCIYKLATVMANHTQELLVQKTLGLETLLPGVQHIIALKFPGLPGLILDSSRGFLSLQRAIHAANPLWENAQIVEKDGGQHFVYCQKYIQVNALRTYRDCISF